MTMDDLSGIANVSRETLARLQSFSAALIKWSSSVNLVSRNTYDDVWSRHIMDSAQLWPLLDVNTKQVLDIGSGGGLPALVLAIVAKENAPNMKFHLVESDQRKAVFLKTIVNKLSLNATVHPVRIEAFIPIGSIDVITSRALASVNENIEYSSDFIEYGTKILLLKGRNWEEEIALARQKWDFEMTPIESITSEDGKILCISNVVKRV